MGKTPTEEVLRFLDRRCLPHPLSAAFSHMIAESLVGYSVLPHELGLSPDRYLRLLEVLYGRGIAEQLRDLIDGSFELRNAAAEAMQRSQLRAELAENRRAEVQDLEHLFDRHSNPLDDLAKDTAHVIALGCLGSAHLYRDLGLPARIMLRQVLSFAVPSLVAQNVNDMRWKRFFYRKLCEGGGDYVCRAPTCQECSSRSECFEISDPT